MTNMIASPVVYRCTVKQTREVFYLVQSDANPGTFYQVRFDHSRLAWSCSCPAHKPCKHERAIAEVLKIRRARTAAKLGGDMPAVVAELQAKEDRKLEQAIAESADTYRAEVAQATIDQAQAVLDEQCSYAPPRVGNFNVRGASVYISDAEMAAIKRRVAARQFEDWSSSDAPIYTSGTATLGSQERNVETTPWGTPMLMK